MLEHHSVTAGGRVRQRWHQRVAPVRWMREPLRAAAIDVLRRLLRSDDGRAALGSAMDGLVDARQRPDVEVRRLVAPPYADLGRARTAEAPPSRRPIIVTGRFRSGSTLLWNIFRSVPSCTSFYEPFNERQWFDPAIRGTRTDATHRQVSDYWREYEDLACLAEHYRLEWIDRGLYMDEHAWAPSMKAYIRTMIERAPGRPVLQFNRVDFRLPWLRATFPDAVIVHLHRHPRDQWISSLVSPSAFPATAPADAFAAHDHFYLRAWARDLAHVYPFLDERSAAHPYQLFYYIWRLSYAFGQTYAHHSVGLEALVDHPRTELKRLLDVVNIHDADVDRLSDCIVRPEIGKWRTWAPADWFAQHESACERVLEDFFGAAAPSHALRTAS